ncbi:alpha-crystallin A chain-like [Brienomyrus brachyistius]|uniref:alpha-crystallin A chain-like n=1 Tax=Brienomyrus brachyistius TaxID=42636 RepID=UPI0020B1B049|nr:alpha-crystallin A chain-like [Brienomyrus brachyistius]
MDIAVQRPLSHRARSPFYLFDQFFREGLFDYDLLPFSSSTISPYYRHTFFRNPESFNSGLSEVRSDGDTFTVCLDVKHFSPEELSVTVEDDCFGVKGKHAECRDDHRFICREFHHRCCLPLTVEQSAISWTLFYDGHLTVCAPKVSMAAESHSSIPVTHEDKLNSAVSS